MSDPTRVPLPLNWTTFPMRSLYGEDAGDYAENLAVHYDPLSLGVAILVNIGYAGAISGLGATLLGSVVLGALGLGALLISNALKGPGPTPQQRQAIVRQSVGPRVRFYGLVKVGGTMFFFESKDGTLYIGVTLNEGEISAINEIWFNDQIVTTDGAGTILEAPYVFSVDNGFFGGGVTNYEVAHIYFKMGTDTQTVHDVLDAAFTEVTTEHRLRGVANFLSTFDEVPSDKIADVYPQLNPVTRIVMDSSLIQNVITGAREYSNRLADCIYDYLTAIDGAGFPYGAGYPEEMIDIESFRYYAYLCDEPVPLKAGGTVARYMCAGGYGLNEELRDVLPRLLSVGDAELYLTSAGKIAIRGGEFTTPRLTLDDTLGHIISAEFRQGQGRLAAFNELTMTYTDPALDFQLVEAERWIDTTNMTLRGKVLSGKLDLPWSPNHSQTRRIGKIYTARKNPHWTGRVVTNFYGMNAIDEQNITLKFSPLGIDETFHIDKLRFLDDLTGVELTVSSLSEDAYSWDAATEEGTAPVVPADTSSGDDLDPPADFHVSAAQRSIDGTTYGTVLVATWTLSDRTSLQYEVRYRVSPNGSFVNMSVGTGIGFAQSGILATGIYYDVSIRTKSAGGATGDWSPSVTVLGTPVLTAPAAVTSVVATAGIGIVTMDWINSASSNAIGVNIYRNTVNTYGSSVGIAAPFGSPGVANEYIDHLAPGTYYYWLTSVNGSGVEGTPVATGAKVVT